MGLSETAVISIRENVELRVYPQGKVLMSFATNQAFEVNHTSWRMIELLKERDSMSIEDMIDLLAFEFKKNAEEISEQVTGFIAECVKLGFVIDVESS